MSKLCSLNARPPSAEGNRSTIAHLCPSSLRTQRSARTARRSTTNALAGRADFRDGGVRHPVGLPEGYHTASRGPELCDVGRRLPRRLAPGPPRGRALPGRRDDARAPAWLGGANPEPLSRSAFPRPGGRCGGTRAAHPTCRGSLGSVPGPELVRPGISPHNPNFGGCAGFHRGYLTP